MTKKQLREALRSAAMSGISNFSQSMAGAQARVDLKQGDKLIRAEDSDGKIIYFEVIVKEVQ